MPGVRLEFSSRQYAYLPTALVVALTLATPIPWPRRAWALVWGLVLIHSFVVLILWLIILHQYIESPSLSLFLLKPFAHRIFNAVYAVLMRAHVFFVVPVMVWLIVSFRREDWVSFTEKVKSAAAQKPESGNRV